jgi:hypothetical protein
MSVEHYKLADPSFVPNGAIPMGRGDYELVVEPNKQFVATIRIPNEGVLVVPAEISDYTITHYDPNQHRLVMGTIF